MKHLDLDISSSRIGWSIFKKSLLKYGYIELTKIETGYFDKIDHAINELEKIATENEIEAIAAEKALERVGSNSNAKTQNVLIAFNFCITYTLSRKLGNIPVEYIEFRKARALAGLKFPRKSDAKKIVRDYVASQYPKIEWPKTKGNKNHAPAFKQFNFDIADAIVIGEAAEKLDVFTKKNSNNQEDISECEREEDS